MGNRSLNNLLADFVVDLLKAYSPTYSEGKAVEVLKSYAVSLGYDEVLVDEVGNLIASYGGGPKKVALIGHIDTIPGELPIVFDGVNVRGRGAVDAKGPLASFFVGASLAKDLINKRDVTVYSIAVVGEEGNSRGIKNLVRKGFRADGVVIAEPSNYNIVVGYRGSVKVKIICRGGGGHTSSPSNGDSACDKLMSVLLKLKSVYNVYKATATSVSLTYMRCGEENANVYPRYGELNLDIRVSVDDVVDNVLNELKGLVTTYLCDFHVLSSVNPVKVSIASNDVVKALTRAVYEQGMKPKFVYKLGTSDMNLAYPTISTNVAAFGPGHSELSHSDLEEISIDELVTGANIYKGFIEKFSKLHRNIK
ncbi:MAG: hypothetical protein B7O98_08485 [Zestosphaera tikiterensis]|uniref:Putative [LysW]-lysine/[LysW]-ornithine hydrolase n=1 Tax=Zestosphaera tikiterensis TaxID=1973259 RepID=A0A2R7Y2X0_9CREN|nr:MAG: hypothetical protein B7O98_08485 [Zestosphaera tikiterensis]